jgi:hypothetical protein
VTAGQTLTELLLGDLLDGLLGTGSQDMYELTEVLEGEDLLLPGRLRSRGAPSRSSASYACTRGRPEALLVVRRSDPEAARKLLYRWLNAGESLADVVGRLRRGYTLPRLLTRGAYTFG